MLRSARFRPPPRPGPWSLACGRSIFSSCAPEDPGDALPGKVSIVEHLGNTTILYVDTPAGQLVVEGRGDLVAKPGDSIGLKIDAPRAHLFGANGAVL